MLTRLLIVAAVLLLIPFTAAAPQQKAKPAAELMSGTDERAATIEAGTLLRAEAPEVIAAVIEYPGTLVSLNPAKNPHKADVLMIGVMKIVVKRGEAVRMPWLVWCRNGKAIAQEHLGMGGLTATE